LVVLGDFNIRGKMWSPKEKSNFLLPIAQHDFFLTVGSTYRCRKFETLLVDVWIYVSSQGSTSYSS